MIDQIGRGELIEKRIAAFDVIRVISMIFVVAVHSLIALDSSNRTIAVIGLALQTIFFTANAMFFMLSGRFNMVVSKKLV